MLFRFNRILKTNLVRVGNGLSAIHFNSLPEMFLARSQILICPDERGIIVIEVPEKFDRDSAWLRGLVTSEHFGVHLPKVAEDRPLVVEGHGLRKAVVELEEKQDLGLGDLVRVSVDKQVV